MLKLALSQYSSAGEKTQNQDSYGARLPDSDLLAYKGASVVLADGISSSQVSHIASQVAVKQFLDDYYCTSDTLSVPRAANQVIQAINRWLYGQTKQSPYAGEQDKGYVCTFSALVFKHQRVYWFHVGDARIYRVRHGQLELLTRDHRQYAGGQQHYLANALGIANTVGVDSDSCALSVDDCFVLLTDGVYEHVDDQTICGLVAQRTGNGSDTAKNLVETAFRNGSDDNLTAQVVWVESVSTDDGVIAADELPIPAVMEAGDEIDDYRILRTLYNSARSHVYLAQHKGSQQQVVLKAPSVEMAHHSRHLEKCCLEEWIMRRIHSEYVAKAPAPMGARSAFYTLSEFVPGITLTQWIMDNPNRDMEDNRRVIEQVARGLMALHRRDVLHQDVRPENIMINADGNAILIDMGAASVGTMNEMGGHDDGVPGTAMYAAPEYFLGQAGSEASDLFSLAVLSYYLLSDRYPYGTDVAKCTSVAAQHKLSYRSVLDPNRSIPFWLDATLKKALHPNPLKRYSTLSEFIYDLRHPNPAYVSRNRPPLLERNPVAFWQVTSGVLLCITLWLLAERFL
ncbi:bifunctional protein-serine/threonine kinase/phosphatase [Alteromonas sp. C1M14]|uniref:bifunctional protein-serine/threonine kinase/phosphatase n=1 Tax=Alteromonas sp. C1M14 TaxID=2841567 RepID=UPI001C09815F|nr:bifunctional protein-serine/threonine kinase/phosphatase [Alteromonas sp. C1M14]MBU2977583.1 protein kinase [Alteromonas sp. C1M14]